jgi:uncharacterized protein YehS (DUF1456 family)
MSNRWLTPLLLVVTLVVILVLVARFALSGPTFRAEDHASYEECVRNIPREWLRGSIEHTRAEAACAHIHHER